MRPLFQKLLTQQKTEDFFTEILAALFREENDLLITWLIDKPIGLEGVHSHSSVEVKTQVMLSKLPGHSEDSRVDLVLKFGHSKGNSVVFIESKVGSDAGKTQIQRYADHLKRYKDYTRKYLLYVTKDYVQEDERHRYEETAKDRGIVFKTIRWFQLHQHLQSYPTNADSFIIRETKKFMEANRMNQKATFDKEDVQALIKLQSVLGLMEETLYSKVRDEFKKTIGTVNRGSSSSVLQVVSKNRYVIYGWFRERWWCFAGYELNGPDENDYPRVMVNLEVDPNSNRADEICETLLSISDQYPEWYFYDGCGWKGISYSKPLSKVLTGPDHVQTIKQFFFNRLKEINEFKRDYANLPWQSAREESTE